MGVEEEEQLGEKIARPIVAIQTVYFTRNVGTKGLSWKVEIGRRKDGKNFGRRSGTVGRENCEADYIGKRCGESGGRAAVELDLNRTVWEKE